MGLENKLRTGSDIDIAVSLFEEHFPKHKNIKFSFKSEKSMPVVDFLTLEASALVSSFAPKGYVHKQNAHEVEHMAGYSGFVYLRKENTEMGAAGFVVEEGEEVVVHGVLYTSENLDPDFVYQRLLEEFKNKHGLGIKKRRAEKSYCWQIS